MTTLRVLATALALATATVTPALAQRQLPATGFADVVEKLLPTVVTIDVVADDDQPRAQRRASTQAGSGVVIAPDGYIVTNHHVVENARAIRVQFEDGRRPTARLVGRDERTDLAVLKVDLDRPLAAATWGDSDRVRVGDYVLAIGNPFGLGGTVTFGILSARGRDLNAGPYDDFLQTDASINSGNSGGPLFDTEGRIIGINTAIYSPTGGSVGIGFAIPSVMARNVVEKLIKDGRVRRPLIGIRYQPIDREIAEALDIEGDTGVLVGGITAGSPAETAGLRVGDVVLSFQGVRIDSRRTLPRQVALAEVGQEVELGILREGQRRTVRLKLAEMPAEEAQAGPPFTSPAPRRRGEAQTPDGRREQIPTPRPKERRPAAPAVVEVPFGLTVRAGERGLEVVEVKPGGAAAARGLRTGDVITELNGQPLRGVGDLARIVTEARQAGRANVLARVTRNGDDNFVPLALEK